MAEHSGGNQNFLLQKDNIKDGDYRMIFVMLV